MLPTAETVTALQKFVFASLNQTTLFVLVWFLPSELKVTRAGDAESITTLSEIASDVFARTGWLAASVVQTSSVLAAAFISSHAGRLCLTAVKRVSVSRFDSKPVAVSSLYN